MASCQPAKPQPSDQIETKGELWNNSKHTLSLEDKVVWKGAPFKDYPETIEKNKTGEFTHLAGSDDDGSYAALAYKVLDEGIWWVVAWKNIKDTSNKVYTDIIDEPVDWDNVKDMLDTEGSVAYDTDKHEYEAEIKIDAKGDSPKMTATIEPDVVSNMAQ
ncbi:hypothetical protein F3Y22_tig00112127pilonHSYRG00059 [Hibiscus syriacus]|uniref:Uncharacterized protein n=1 Tax=Hibiscus syriacus TaxID=106335 RepID=A0A6A2YDT5_HIBSY|nr:uncharacterized protein LOC120174890 [Hibiscus syriacus]KAE8670524.1 hypothetical protein F3Y22_tig00112127pilonHSYRG00059 [Hibiscus syriacus]